MRNLNILVQRLNLTVVASCSLHCWVFARWIADTASRDVMLHSGMKAKLSKSKVAELCDVWKNKLSHKLSLTKESSKLNAYRI